MIWLFETILISVAFFGDGFVFGIKLVVNDVGATLVMDLFFISILISLTLDREYFRQAYAERLKDAKFFGRRP